MTYQQKTASYEIIIGVQKTEQSILKINLHLILYSLSIMSFFGQQPLVKPIFAFWVLLLLLGIGSSRHSVAASQHKFYYFNPDSAQSNLVRLKGAMDNFLTLAEISVAFTPFARLNDFDRLTKSEPPSFIFLPKWYLEQNNNLGFIPLLEPVRNGSTNYQKFLLTQSMSDISLQSMKKRTLAMTSLGPQGETLLNKMLFDKHNIDVKDINIVVTPKDSDALFALVLGQVEMALVSKNNFERISTMNSRVTQSIRTLSKTKPIPLPALCYRKGSVPAAFIEKIKKAFLQTNRKTDKIMEMLQIDAWKVSTSD